jgi:transposase InsO family protein
MGSVGTSADNALAESFNATLKREWTVPDLVDTRS